MSAAFEDMFGPLVSRMQAELSVERFPSVSMETWSVLVLISMVFNLILSKTCGVVAKALFPAYRKMLQDPSEPSQRSAIEWTNRSAGAVVGVIATICGFLILQAERFEIYKFVWGDEEHMMKVWAGATPLQVYSMAYLTGYMFSDSLLMVSRIFPGLPNLRDSVIFFHHASVIFIYSSVSFVPVAYGVTCMCFELFFESSTPFLAIRWMLLKSGRSNSKLYFWNGLVFVTLFFLARIVWGTYVTYAIYNVPSNIVANVPVIWFFSVTFGFLQYYWFYEIIMLVVNERRKNSKTKKT